MARNNRGRAVRRRARRRKKTSTGRIYVAIVMLFMIAVMAIQVIRLYDKNQELKKEEATLQEQVDAANEKSEQLKEEAEFAETDEYTEREAAEKLGLTYENWITFRQED